MNYKSVEFSSFSVSLINRRTDGSISPETGGQFAPKQGGQFGPGDGGQFQRIFHLKANQHYDLMDYKGETRKVILLLFRKNHRCAFTRLGCIINFDNLLLNFINQLKKQNPKTRVIKQLQALAISNWLKIHA